MRSLLSSLALAWSLPTSVSSAAESGPQIIAANDLVLRQTTNSSTTVNAATWIYPSSNSNGNVPLDSSSNGAAANITFSITIDPKSNNMWFRLAAPATYSWISIGAGTRMNNAKAFFVAWEGKTANSVILTARGACDNCEPAYIKDFGVNAQQGSSNDPAALGIRGGVYYINGFVANGTLRSGIDPNSQSQSFMWAVGDPDKKPNSDAFDAPLWMHKDHGIFQLDMTKAHGTALPAFQTTEAGVTNQGAAWQDSDRASNGHAFLMVIGFVIILPTGILLLRTMNKVKVHMIVQAVGLAVITLGTGLGFYISREYQRSMSYSHPHQIIGILVYLLLHAQFWLGFFHHRAYVRTQRSTWMIKPHKFGLGGVVLGLGIVNCAVGFGFAGSYQYNQIFVPVVIALALLLVGALVFRGWMAKKKARKQVMFGGPPPSGYQAPQGSAVQPLQQDSSLGESAGYYSAGASLQRTPSNVELGNLGPPPAYSGEPQKPREMI